MGRFRIARRPALFVGGVLAAVFAATSCGGTDPHAVPGPSAPPLQVTTQHVFGAVLDGDDATPIPGAVLAPFPMTSPRLLTDPSGQFDFTTASNAVTVGVFVMMTKTGYDDALGFAPFGGDGRHDFRLYRSLTINAGATIRLPITEDNELCQFENGEFGQELRCRTVHVEAPSSGMLTAETSSDDSSDPYWIHIGSPGDLRLPFQGVTRVQQPVAAGTVVTLQIMRPRIPAPSGHFTLRTALSN